ncbi:hypothetical protein CPC08DRAFT_727905 [Agrocybe pediades]|nr:hypothetical protein CPC08DRAFT_727905 [Agrocybe pediades]
MKKTFEDVEVVDLTVDTVVSRPRSASAVEETRSNTITRRVDAVTSRPRPITQEMDARAESLKRLLEALEGFDTGNRVTVDVDEDLEESQDVVICYAMSPEDEGHVSQGVGAFGSAGTINTSSTCEDRAVVVAPELFLTPPSPPNRSLLITYQKRKDDDYLSPSPLFASTFIPVDAVVVTEEVQVQVEEEDDDDDSAFDAAYFDLFDDENARDARIAQQALSSAQEFEALLGPTPNVGHSHLFDEDKEDPAMVAQRALATAQEFEDLLNGF